MGIFSNNSWTWKVLVKSWFDKVKNSPDTISNLITNKKNKGYSRRSISFLLRRPARKRNITIWKLPDFLPIAELAEKSSFKRTNSKSITARPDFLFWKKSVSFFCLILEDTKEKPSQKNYLSSKYQSAKIITIKTINKW